MWTVCYLLGVLLLLIQLSDRITHTDLSFFLLLSYVGSRFTHGYVSDSDRENEDNQREDVSTANCELVGPCRRRLQD